MCSYNPYKKSYIIKILNRTYELYRNKYECINKEINKCTVYIGFFRTCKRI